MVHQREVVLYTRSRSLSSWRAKRLLEHAGYDFQQVDVTNDPEAHAMLSGVRRGELVLPYLFVDHRPVGDFGTIKALAHSGTLEHLVREEL